MKVKRWLKIILIPLIFLEVALRFAPEPRIAAHWVQDPVLGFKGPANATIDTPTSLIHYNESGFRALPPAVAKGLAPRVAILGDSITEAATTPVESTFPALLQTSLGGEVREYSAGDWGTVQELLAYRDFAQALKPDVVLVQFSALNDFHNNSPKWAGLYQSRLDSLRPYWDGSKAFYLHPIDAWVRKHSTFARWVSALLLNAAVTEDRPLKPGCAADPNLAGVEIYRVTREEPAKLLLEETAQVFRALRVEAAATRVVAVFFPNPLDLNPDLYAAVIDEQLRTCHPKEPPPDPSEAEKKFFEAAKAGGIEAWSLREGFGKAMKAGENLFLPDGQLSPAGHVLAARLIALRLSSSP
jgi:hypothetical protein